MRSEISSAWTFLFKFVFPLPFFVFSFSVVFFAWCAKSPPVNSDISLAQFKFFSLAFALFFIGLPIFIFGWLKRIHLDKDNIHISNYFREIVVPIANIKGIEEYLGPRLKPTKIYFHEPTGFGTEIEFIPRDTFLPWRRSLIVVELRKLANVT